MIQIRCERRCARKHQGERRVWVSPSAKMSSGRDLLQKAEKKATAPSSFFSFGSSSSKHEEAHDLYISAANAFIIEKQWKESGDCFVKAGECALKTEDKDDAAGDFWKASKSYKKTNPERKPSSLLHSVTAVPRTHSSDPQWRSEHCNALSNSSKPRAPSARPLIDRRRSLPSSSRKGEISSPPSTPSKKLPNSIPPKMRLRQSSVPPPAHPTPPTSSPLPALHSGQVSRANTMYSTRQNSQRMLQGGRRPRRDSRTVPPSDRSLRASRRRKSAQPNDEIRRQGVLHESWNVLVSSRCTLSCLPPSPLTFVLIAVVLTTIIGLAGRRLGKTSIGELLKCGQHLPEYSRSQVPFRSHRCL